MKKEEVCKILSESLSELVIIKDDDSRKQGKFVPKVHECKMFDSSHPLYRTWKNSLEKEEREGLVVTINYPVTRRAMGHWDNVPDDFDNVVEGAFDFKKLKGLPIVTETPPYHPVMNLRADPVGNAMRMRIIVTFPKGTVT